MLRSPLLSPASPPVGLAAFLILTSYYIPFIIHPSIEIDRPFTASAPNLSSTTVRRPFAKPALGPSCHTNHTICVTYNPKTW